MKDISNGMGGMQFHSTPIFRIQGRSEKSYGCNILQARARYGPANGL